jgi:hypothetical protein
MAELRFDVSILEGLARDAMHSEDIERTLAELKRRLADEKIPFALLGALAMRRYGYVRHTEDIDILTTREGLDKIHARLVGLGFMPRSPGLRKSLKHAGFEVNIDVILTGEHAGAQDSPLIYPHPESDAFVDRDGLRIPRLEKLIEIKLVSGQWGHRMGDLGDVFRLIQLNKLDEKTADLLIPEVRPKYIELLGESRKEKKLEE